MLILLVQDHAGHPTGWIVGADLDGIRKKLREGFHDRDVAHAHLVALAELANFEVITSGMTRLSERSWLLHTGWP